MVRYLEVWAFVECKGGSVGKLPRVGELGKLPRVGEVGMLR